MSLPSDSLLSHDDPPGRHDFTGVNLEHSQYMQPRDTTMRHAAHFD